MAFILLDYTIIHLIIYGTSDDYLGFPNKNIETDVQASNRNQNFILTKNKRHLLLPITDFPTKPIFTTTSSSTTSCDEGRKCKK